MHQTNSSLRIAELEAVLGSTIEFLKKLPTHPMTSMVIKGAEAKLYAPANQGTEGREAEGLISRTYAPNGALLIGVESTSKGVTITTANIKIPQLRDLHIYRLQQMLETGLTLPPLNLP